MKNVYLLLIFFSCISYTMQEKQKQILQQLQEIYVSNPSMMKQIENEVVQITATQDKKIQEFKKIWKGLTVPLFIEQLKKNGSNTSMIYLENVRFCEPNLKNA